MEYDTTVLPHKMSLMVGVCVTHDVWARVCECERVCVFATTERKSKSKRLAELGRR